MDITAGSGGVSAEDEDGGRQDGWLGTTLGMEAGFVAGDLGSEIGFGRGSSGGSSADPNETLAAADKEPPSSNEASSAGDAKKNKRIRFDRARGGHLTLLLDVTTGSGGGGGGCERIVKLRPGETSEPYVGNKPLASMVISGEVSVSDSAISGQAAANLKASISVLQQLCSWKKSDLQKFTDGACGALKYKVDKINAHAKLLSLSPSLLFFCVTSDDLNASVMYEDSSADGAFKSLVLSEFGEDRASSHIFVSVASSDTGESSAFESLSKSLKPDSRLQATYIKELVKAAASLCEVNGVKFSLLCQDPGSSPAWIQAFGERPDSESKGPFQRHFPVGDAAFGASQVAAAVNTNYLSGTTKASRLLYSLLSTPFPVGSPPSKLEVSSYLSLLGPTVVSAVTSSLRSELRRVDPSHKKNYASSFVSPELYPAVNWEVPAREMLVVLFGSSFGSGGGSGNAEADLMCDFDFAGGGAALPENEDDDDDGRAAARPRLEFEQRGRLTLGHSVFRSELPALPAGSESEAVTAFFQYCGNHAVSLVSMADVSGGTCLVSLPPYDPVKQVVTHEKPCLVTLVCIEGNVTVRCSCSASRRRALELCWHEKLAKKPGMYERLSNAAVATASRLSGAPVGNVVVVLSTKKSQGGPSVPRRVHVYVRVPTTEGKPGNAKAAILTVVALKRPKADGRAYHVSCDSCLSGSKTERTVSNRARCQHLTAARAAASADPSVYKHLVAIFNHSPVPEPPPRVYDLRRGTWDFPSLDRDIKRARAPTRVPVRRRERQPQSDRGSASLGGPGDPSQGRCAVLFDVLGGTSTVLSLVRHGFATATCGCGEGIFHLDVGVNGKCSRCILDVDANALGGSCTSCTARFCSECAILYAKQHATIQPSFYQSFTEFSHLELQPQSNLFFEELVAGVTQIASMSPTSQPPLDLKPPLPPPLEESDMDAEVCSYNADGYTLNGTSWVFGLACARLANVYALNCSQKHPSCRIEFSGTDRGMHRQTAETIITEDVLDLFWQCQRSMKGASAQSFARLVREIYHRSGSEKRFLSDPLFRDCFFAYQSSFADKFNVPCITCPLMKCPETGEIYTDCKVIGLDAVSIRMQKNDTKEEYHFNAPVPESPTVDVRRDHIYDRLYFPGPEKSAVGELRIEVAELCRKVLRNSPLVKGEFDFLTLAQRFAEQQQTEAFSGAVALIASSLPEAGPRLPQGRSEANLVRRMATFLLMLCNPQAEILQVTNLEEAEFCAQVLRRDTESLLSASFLDNQLQNEDIHGVCLRWAISGALIWEAFREAGWAGGTSSKCWVPTGRDLKSLC